MSNKKSYGGRLEDWYTSHPQAHGQYVIFGLLHDDPNSRFGPDGTSVRTSIVVHMNKAETKVETLNTLYKLGKKHVG